MEKTIDASRNTKFHTDFLILRWEGGREGGIKRKKTRIKDRRKEMKEDVMTFE